MRRLKQCASIYLLLILFSIQALRADEAVKTVAEEPKKASPAVTVFHADEEDIVELHEELANDDSFTSMVYNAHGSLENCSPDELQKLEDLVRSAREKKGSKKAKSKRFKNKKKKKEKNESPSPEAVEQAGKNGDMKSAVRESVREVLSELFGRVMSSLGGGQRGRGRDAYHGSKTEAYHASSPDHSSEKQEQEDFSKEPAKRAKPKKIKRNVRRNRVNNPTQLAGWFGPAVQGHIPATAHKQPEANHARRRTTLSQQQSNASARSNQQTSTKVQRSTSKNTPPGKRAITASGDENVIPVHVTAFAGPNRFFIGPNSTDSSAGPDDDNYASSSHTFSRAHTERDTDNARKLSVVLSALDGGEFDVTVNGAIADASPFTEKAVAHVALAGSDKMPAVVLRGNPKAADDRRGAQVFQLTDDTGRALLTNEAEMKDAANAAINQQVVALAATQPSVLDDSVVFAAVADGSKLAHPIVKRLDDDQGKEKTAIKDFIKDGFATFKTKNTGGTAGNAVDAIDGNDKTINKMIELLQDEVYDSGLDGLEPVAQRIVKRVKDGGDKTDELSKLVNSIGGNTVSIHTDISAENIIAAAQIADAGNNAQRINDGNTNATKRSEDTKQHGSLGAVEAGFAWALQKMLMSPAKGNFKDKDIIKEWASTFLDGKAERVAVTAAEGFNRGIAVLKHDGGKLVPVGHQKQDGTDPDDLALDKYASHLKTLAESDASLRTDEFDKTKPNVDPGVMKTCAFYAPGDPKPINHAAIGPDVDMYWDEPLQRLYVGLSDVTRAAKTGVSHEHSGGVCSVLVGDLDVDNKLQLHPVIKNVSSYLFQDKVKDPDGNPDLDDQYKNYLLGFNLSHDAKYPGAAAAVAEKKLVACAKKIRVMHTSTGLSYLIINGGVAAQGSKEELNAQVFAVPLVNHNDKKHKGYVASGDNGQFGNAGGGFDTFKESVDLSSILAAIKANAAAAVTASKEDIYVNNNAKPPLGAEAVEGDENLLQSIASLILKYGYVSEDRSTDANSVVQRAAVDIAKNKDETLITAARDLLRAKVAGANAVTVDNITGYFAPNKNPNPADVATASAEGTAAAVAGNFATAKGNHNDHALGVATAIASGVAWAANRFYNGGDGSERNKYLKLVKTGMHRSSDAHTQVGGSPQYISFDKKLDINDMHIVGDTVYIAVGGGRDEDHTREDGVFASTALFDEKGRIYAWSPWTRMLGRAKPIHSLALDTASGNVWWLGKPSKGSGDASYDTVNITQWSKGDTELHGTSSGDDEDVEDDAEATQGSGTLSSVLDGLFAPVGGVLGLFDFGPGTQGFKQQSVDALAADKRARHQQFSMMVATGRGSVALVETGRYDIGSSVFVPTTKFEKDTNVACFGELNDRLSMLPELGEIVAAEVARVREITTRATNQQNTGWLFVGGKQGIAILVRPDGKGWNTATGLDRFRDNTNAANFPFGSDWRFLGVKISSKNTDAEQNPFKDVRRIVSDQDRFIYILTRTELWRIDMTKASFKKQAKDKIYASEFETHVSGGDTAIKIASVSESKDAHAANILGEDEEFFDMVILDRDLSTDAAPADGNKTKLALATSKGIFRSIDGGGKNLVDNFSVNDAPNLHWKPVKHAEGAALGNTLLFESTSKMPGDQLYKYNNTNAGKWSAEGNLHATAFDENNQFLGVYRFAMHKGDLKPIKEKYVDDDNKTVGYFYKVGLLTQERDKGLDRAEFLGARDFVLRAKHVARSTRGFAERVAMLPAPSKFLPNSAGMYDQIDLGFDVVLPMYMGKTVHDSASGARYVAGEFGVRVNE